MRKGSSRSQSCGRESSTEHSLAGLLISPLAVLATYQAPPVLGGRRWPAFKSCRNDSRAVSLDSCARRRSSARNTRLEHTPPSRRGVLLGGLSLSPRLGSFHPINNLRSPLARGLLLKVACGRPGDLQPPCQAAFGLVVMMPARSEASNPCHSCPTEKGHGAHAKTVWQPRRPRVYQARLARFKDGTIHGRAAWPPALGPFLLSDN
jgi:hypothetical protein